MRMLVKHQVNIVGFYYLEFSLAQTDTNVLKQFVMILYDIL